MNVVTSEVGIRTLRLELSRYLAAVQQGQEVVVTDHGRPIARLIPAQASNHQLADLIDSGDAEAAQIAKDDWVPTPLDVAPGVTISDLVADQRQ
jgi:prevent-host-death family protein